MNQNPPSSDNVAALPKHLEERFRLVNGQAIKIRGEFVLYWMHHAARGHGLRQLTMRAAALVVEDFPAQPLPRWTKRLAEAHTVGGSGAGYARWQRFLQSGLAAYARDRKVSPSRIQAVSCG